MGTRMGKKTRKERRGEHGFREGRRFLIYGYPENSVKVCTLALRIELKTEFSKEFLKGFPRFK